MHPGSFRLLLAGIVVVHHSFPIRMGNWAVGMFFVLSGYWISKMWREKYSRHANPYRTYLLSRWWRLAPLYLFIQFTAAALVLAGLKVGDYGAVADWRWWLTQPLIIGSTQFARLLPPSWSLDTEMQFYLVAPLLVGWALRANRGLVAVAWTILLAWSAARLYGGATMDTPNLDIFLWLFLTGVACDRFDFRPSPTLAIGSAVLVTTLVSLILLMPATRGLIWIRGSEGATESFAPEILFLASSVIGIPAAISTVHVRSGKFDRWLGDLSYPLYLCHWLSRDWYYSVVDWSRPSWENALLLMCNFAMAIAAAVLLLHFVDRPAQQLKLRLIRPRDQTNEDSISAPAVNHA